MRGSICLYQGEELGLPEAELAFEDLRDPYGIRFWPAFKGRDGCRTPMAWEAARANAGFTSAAKSWLPVPHEHAALAVDAQEADDASVLHHYRRTLAFRKSHPALRDGDLAFLDTGEEVLAFTRKKDGETLLFVFNLVREPAKLDLPEGLAHLEAVAIPGFSATHAGAKVTLDGLDVFCGRVVEGA